MPFDKLLINYQVGKKFDLHHFGIHLIYRGFTKLKIVDFVNKSMENELSKYGDSAKINHTPRSKILFSS
jgi:hypothetical protein